MLSNPTRHYSDYHTLPSNNNMLPTGHVPSNHLNDDMDSLGHSSQFSFQQLPRQAEMQQIPNSQRSITPKHRQHPYNASSTGALGGRSPSISGSQTGGVRRRISRACDQCNQLRTKCDGQTPCAHCVEFSLGCEYIRERKKRGKASRKDLALQAAAAAAAAQNRQKSPGSRSADDDSNGEARYYQGSSVVSPQEGSADARSMNGTSATHPPDQKMMVNGGVNDILNRDQPQMPHLGSNGGGDQNDTISQSHLGISSSSDLNGFSTGYSPSNHLNMMNGGGVYSSGTSLPGYSDLPYAMQSPSAYNSSYQPGYRMGDSPLPGFSLQTPNAGSPNWPSMPSPINQFPTPPQLRNHQPQLRYPVLRPLLPYLGNILPISLACELFDLYFASSSSAQMHPMSPYVLGFVFRKRSFLHPTKPRACTPALLASILWVSAQTCDATFLTSLPSARGRICQRLLELTVNLLKPLIHGPQVDETNFANTVINGVALGGLGVAMPGTAHAEAMSGETGAFGAAGALDDVVTYIHLATVVSASEYKGASLRWWNAAWSLARELKLGRELPSHPSMQNDLDADGEFDSSSHAPLPGSRTPGSITEEEREERRRIWWLVYTVDRHLSLCYNKPLFLLDVECDGLLQPMDDRMWQAGDNYSGNLSIHISSPSGSAFVRRRGPNFECTSHSIFGYFLPLMTILGEIVDLRHAKNHPRFGVSFRSAQEWEDYSSVIRQQLEDYGRSLKEFERRPLSHSLTEESPGGPDSIASPSASIHTSNSRMSQESDIQTKIVVAYGTHVMHVLHILLTGKWDPITLLDDDDLWISSQSFITATGHAVSAAEAIENILEYDPGLEFMPFFFGVYLLQGSFLLLLIADKLQSEASPSVVKACETIVRAHEACVATLNTEYQRNFRKVMRSALAQVRGRLPEGIGEQQLRRRDVLSLYRWTGDGTGLAL